jgi:hypothetical protein
MDSIGVGVAGVVAVLLSGLKQCVLMESKLSALNNSLAKLEDFPEFDDVIHTERPAERSKSELDNNDDGGGGKPRPALHGPKAHHEADHRVENLTASTRCVIYG